jgi:hypothetical protein
MPSYGSAFLVRACQIYRERTGARLAMARVHWRHAIAALEQLGWGLRVPGEHDRTGRTLEQTRAWAEAAVDAASSERPARDTVS